MNAGACQPENGIARHHAMRQQPAAFRRANREAGKVVVVVVVEARHLGGLPPNQRTTGLVATRRDPGDHLPRLPRIQLAGGEVVEEEQRFGALHHDVVDAHRHQIDADRVVDAGFDRDLELGADAVGGRDQHWIDEPRRLQIEQGAEATQSTHHTRPVRRPGQRLDRLDQGIGRRDIDAGSAVGQPVAGR